MYRRWTKYWWKDKWHTLLDIPYKLKKVAEWLPVIWRQADWDQSYLYELLAYKFERMERRSLKSCLANWETQNRDYLICKNLMRRLRANEYIDYGLDDYTLHPYFKSKRGIIQHESLMQKQDKELFCKLFLRKVDTWWD